MPLFEATIAVNGEDVAEVLKHHWNLQLGPIIKGKLVCSQTHSFDC